MIKGWWSVFESMSKSLDESVCVSVIGRDRACGREHECYTWVRAVEDVAEERVIKYERACERARMGACLRAYLRACGGKCERTYYEKV
jgi:hypothetical protein